MSTFHMSAGGLVVAVLSFKVISLPTETTLGWVVLGGAILCFAGAFFIMIYFVRLTGPVRTAMMMNLEPVITISLSVLILGKVLH